MKRSDAGERRQGQRNCKEADTAERRGWCEDGAGFGRKQGRSESEVNYLRSLCGVLEK